MRFNNKLYTEMLFLDGNNQLQSYEYSTLKPVRDQAQNLLSPPSVESVSVDRDNDGRPEQWNITMRVRKPQTDFKLEQASIIIAFDYKTTETVALQMETLAVA